jgi:hypothetical protein
MFMSEKVISSTSSKKVKINRLLIVLLFVFFSHAKEDPQGTYSYELVHLICCPQIIT